MFPVLFSIGPLELKTMSLFLILAFFLASFIFWRKGREEHYSQADIFDSFLISALIGAFVARAIFIVFNFNSFGFYILNWFDLGMFPGINLIAGLIAAAIYMYRNAIKNKWDTFEVLDFWVTSIALGLSIYYLGSFFDGTGYGYATNLPWGVVFPQIIEPHHPVQMYFALFYLGLYVYLSKVEYLYRTFTWYRHGKKTAQTGFLTSIFLIAVAVFTFLMALLKPATLEFMSINFDMVISFGLAIFGLGLLYSRSGRNLPIISSKKPKPVLTKLEDLHE
jgi:phosphatidylglycerol---prolipoprotein diacylglyceryl transferase